ncbi:uncharacterized protein LOC122817619 isoform X2 [Protopterus annectens]|uniref:uncharacterized protein LOC122817619 isoform X2 n=1 Tax=Protopterus annectens TaxID=7888 RepID=UPI001CF9FF33|nr:uncharacterized protein LOC122817619 isoform X2 [Protopterus annectens]
MEAGQKSLAAQELQTLMFCSYFLTLLCSVALSKENHGVVMTGKEGQVLCEKETSMLKYEIVQLNKVIEALKRQLQERARIQNVPDTNLSQKIQPKMMGASQQHINMKKNSSESLMEPTEINLQMSMDLDLKPELLQVEESEQKQTCAETSQQLSDCEQHCSEFQIMLERISQKCERDKNKLIQKVQGQ